MGLKAIAGAVKLGAKRHAPEIMYGAGAVSMIAAIVCAFKARPRYEEILEDHRNRVAKQKLAEEKADEAPDDIYPDNRRLGDRIHDGIVTGMKMAVCFWKVVAFGGAALGFFFMHGKIYKGWFLGAAAAASEASRKLKVLEAATAAEVGEQKLQDIKDRVFAETVEEKRMAEDGNLSEEDYEVIQDDKRFVKFFDDNNPNWRDDAEANYNWLRAKERTLNVRLQAQGYLFANDVWKELNMPLTEYGQIYGIMAKDKHGITQALDFGMLDGKDPGARNFKNGYESTFMINPNFDPEPIVGKVNYAKSWWFNRKEEKKGA